jgi:hypothetical protein
MFEKYLIALCVLFVLAEMGYSTRVAPKLDFEDSKEFITNHDQTRLTPIIRGVRVTVDTSKLKGSPGMRKISMPDTNCLTTDRYFKNNQDLYNIHQCNLVLGVSKNVTNSV